MEKGQNAKKLRNSYYYLFATLKFYDLKPKYLTPVLFTIALAANFYVFLQVDSILDMGDILLDLANTIIISVVSAIYLAANLREIKGESYTAKSCISVVFNNSLRIVAVSVIADIFLTAVTWFLSLGIGLIVFAVPYLMFMFTNCYIIDRNKGFLKSFTASKSATDFRKMEIITKISAFFLVILVSFLYVISVGANPKNTILFPFILSFAYTLFGLMNQRLIALLYVDLEYVREVNEQKEE